MLVLVPVSGAVDAGRDQETGDRDGEPDSSCRAQAEATEAQPKPLEPNGPAECGRSEQEGRDDEVLDSSPAEGSAQSVRRRERRWGTCPRAAATGSRRDAVGESGPSKAVAWAWRSAARDLGVDAAGSGGGKWGIRNLAR